MRAPYRQPSDRVEWTPTTGDRVVIVESEWTRTWDYVGMRGEVGRVRGNWVEVRNLDGWVPYLVNLVLSEIAPVVE
jgi:hypothetical protein